MIDELTQNRNCCLEDEDENSSMTNCNNTDDLRREMMMQLRAYYFCINDLAIYLDTHPDDEKALCLHRNYAKKAHDLSNEYQKMYGPLNISYPCNKWRWLEEPWPWERGNF
jgi:spore coat protein JB